MTFLDVKTLPLSSGDLATALFLIGVGIALAVYAVTGGVLTLHFRKERKREDNRKEKRMVLEEE